MSNKITVRYNRVSSEGQNLARQQKDNHKYVHVIEDKESGTIPLFERSSGKALKQLVDDNKVERIVTDNVDRLGRDLQELLNLLDYLHERGVSVEFEQLGLITLTPEGKVVPQVKMMVSMMGAFAEMFNADRKIKQMEGIEQAKKAGKYIGRKTRSKIDPVKFLTANKAIKTLLESGMGISDISQQVGKSRNHIYKVKRMMDALAAA